jgi:hypothetical protein
MPTSQPPACHSSEYVTLKEYIDTRLDAMEQATILSRQVMDARLTSLNEIRDALRDRDTTFISKVEFNAIIARIEVGVSNLQEDARSLRESRANLEGKADQSDVMKVLVLAIIGILLSVIGLILGFFGA